MNINQKKCAIACALALVVAIVAMFRQLIAPADWVEVHLEQVPPDISELYLVAKKDGQTQPLKWYQSMGYRFLADPKIVGEQWYWTVGGTRRKGDVQWVTSGSIGVLAKLNSNKWILWWLNPEDIDGPSSMRYFWGGGEKVTIHIPGIESSEVAPKSLINQVMNCGK